MADGGLLLVHAHPDDEVFATGGTMARAVAEGRRVDLVVCTGGEEGEIHDPDLDPAEAAARLGDIRTAELECSLAALGSGSIGLHRLGFRDSGMMGTPPNDDPRAFWQASVIAAGERVAEIIRQVRRWSSPTTISEATDTPTTSRPIEWQRQAGPRQQPMLAGMRSPSRASAGERDSRP
jgi:N-acetyl-1-D-myo-inositol-2-amino-2-deoxy-alpha-D-glucopyranoside deacetylase